MDCWSGVKLGGMTRRGFPLAAAALLSFLGGREAAGQPLSTYLVQIHVFVTRSDQFATTITRAATSVIGCRFGSNASHLIKLTRGYPASYSAGPDMVLAVDLSVVESNGGQVLRLGATDAYVQAGPLIGSGIRQWVDLTSDQRVARLVLKSQPDQSAIEIVAEVL